MPKRIGLILSLINGKEQQGSKVTRWLSKNEGRN